MIVEIGLRCDVGIPRITLSRNIVGTLPVANEVEHGNRTQDSNDGDHNEEFDEREACTCAFYLDLSPYRQYGDQSDGYREQESAGGRIHRAPGPEFLD